MLRSESATPGCLKQELCLHHLAPERGFIASEPLEQAIVETGESLEAMCQVSCRNVSRRISVRASGGQLIRPLEATVIPGLIANRDPWFDNTKRHGLQPFQLIL